MAETSAQNGMSERTPVAQLVEQRIPNPQVAGSSPSRRDSDGAGAPHGHHHSFIYKPGEGYWIRVMTLAMIALIALTSAGWAYKSLDALSPSIPAKAWSLGLKGAGGAAAVGQPVTLLTTKGSTTADPVQIGTAKVEQVSNLGGETVVQISAPSLSGAQSVLDVENQTIKIGDASVLVSSVRAIPSFDLEYAQIGAAAFILAVGVWCGYWFVGRNRTSVEFLIATDSEMRKVNWTTRREIMGSTYVVIGAGFLVALSLFLIDYGFSHLFIAVDLLRLNQ